MLDISVLFVTAYAFSEQHLARGTYQPRDTFSEEALEPLSKTIDQLGVLDADCPRINKKP